MVGILLLTFASYASFCTLPTEAVVNSPSSIVIRNGPRTAPRVGAWSSSAANGSGATGIGAVTFAGSKPLSFRGQSARNAGQTPQAVLKDGGYEGFGSEPRKEVLSPKDAFYDLMEVKKMKFKNDHRKDIFAEGFFTYLKKTLGITDMRIDASHMERYFNGYCLHKREYVSYEKALVDHNLGVNDEHQLDRILQEKLGRESFQKFMFDGSLPEKEAEFETALADSVDELLVGNRVERLLHSQWDPLRIYSYWQAKKGIVAKTLELLKAKGVLKKYVNENTELDETFMQAFGEAKMAQEEVAKQERAKSKFTDVANKFMVKNGVTAEERKAFMACYERLHNSGLKEGEEKEVSSSVDDRLEATLEEYLKEKGPTSLP